MNAVVARVLFVATLGAAAAVLFGPQPLAVTGGIALGFALPGLALTAVLFRGRTLSAVERTVLAPGLSLAVLVVSGLVIYVAGFALNRNAWTSASAGVTVVALIVPAIAKSGRSVRLAAKRAAEKEADGRIADMAAAAALAVRAATRGPGENRVRIQASDATVLLPVVRGTDDMTQQFLLPPLVIPVVKPPVVKQKPPLKRIFRQLVPLVLVLAVLGGASRLSLRSSHDSYDVTVTTLSAAVPGPVDAAGSRTVAVSATGLIAADGPYTVRVSSADGVQTEKLSVAVPAGGAWSMSLTMPGRQRMTVNLYRSGDTTAYRTLYIAADE